MLIHCFFLVPSRPKPDYVHIRVPVSISKHPWENGGGEGKYSYHPGGNQSAEPKEAPSAVNVVVVPDVSLPKVCSVTLPFPLTSPRRTRPMPCPSCPDMLANQLQNLHEKYNKWGKDGY